MLIPSPNVPDWNSKGVIEPIDPKNPASISRSPYLVTLTQVIQRFAITQERIDILRGFLDYRSELHAIGINQGFQWLNGSFLENKEYFLNTPPGDIDVATFFHMPSNTTQTQLFARNPFLFGPNAAIKKQYSVDAYLIPIQMPPEDLIWNTHYWYGLFAHSRRNFVWKGFLQVELSSSDDKAASTVLANIAQTLVP